MKRQMLIPRDFNDNDISKWGLPPGAIRRFGQGYASDMAFCSHNGVVAVTTTEGVWWYKLPTLSPVALWKKEDETAMFSSCAFSQDGRFFAAGGLDGANVWDVNSGEGIAKLTRPDLPEYKEKYHHLYAEWMSKKFYMDIDWLTFSPNGQLLAAASLQRNTSIDVWQLETGEHFAHLEEDMPENIANSRTGPLAFSADSCLLACAQTYRFGDCHSDGVDSEVHFISVWDMDVGKRIACIMDFPEMVDSLTFSPCNRFLAIGGFGEGLVQIWKVLHCELQKTYSISSIEGTYVSYSQDGILRAAGSSMESTIVWDLEQNKLLYTYPEYAECLRQSFVNGTHLVSMTPQKLNVWSFDDGTARTSRHLHNWGSIFSLAFSPDGKTLASTIYGTGLSLWDISNSQNFPQVFDPVSKFWFSVGVFPGGKFFATSGNENRVNLWEIGNDAPLASFTIEAKVVDAAFSPTKNLLACRDAGDQVYIWDVQSGELRNICQGGYTSSERMVFSPDGKYLVSGVDDLLYDVAQGEKIETFDLTEMSIHLFSHDSTYFFCDTRSRESIELWSIRSREKLLSIPTPQTGQRLHAAVLALSSCGRYLANSSKTVDSTLSLWEVKSGKLITVLKVPSRVLSLAFSPDNTILASSGTDGTILLWDMKPYLEST